MTFEEECVEWLKPFGYEIHSFNPEKTIINFINYYNLDLNYPAIKCEAEGKRVTLTYTLKMWIIMKTEIQFKHPDIKKYLDTFNYYATLCEKYPPF